MREEESEGGWFRVVNSLIISRKLSCDLSKMHYRYFEVLLNRNNGD